MEHLYNFSFAFTHLKVCFQQAIALRHFIETRNISPDHIIFYNYWLYKNVITCALHNRVAETSIPIISRAHSGDLYHSTWYQINAGANITFLPFEHFKVKATQRIFCISSHGLHHLQRTFPQYKSKFELARLGVRKSASINKILDKGLFQIVTCSLISANKRIHLMPEILSHLRDLNIIWTHFGWGDDAIVHELKQSIAHHRVESVCHLRGTVPNAEITRMYETEQVNLLVNLSRAEGIPVSIMEAFSFGVPAIATSTVGNPEIVDTDSGYLIPVDFSIEHIAQLIRQLATDEALQQKLRDGARRKFESHFDAQINYSHFAAELGEICNSRNSGQSM
ncbi:MAG: glycosyltransferase [Flavobacteriales bacterium]